MSARFRRSETVLTAEFDDTLMMLNVETGSYHDINGTGARIWALLAEPRTEAELVAALVISFDVSPEICAEQVAEFIDMLRDRNLIFVA